MCFHFVIISFCLLQRFLTIPRMHLENLQGCEYIHMCVCVCVNRAGDFISHAVFYAEDVSNAHM